MSVGIFTCLLQYFPKNRTILVQKLWGEKKLSKSVFGYFKTKKKIQQKKVPMATKLEGGVGGKALVARPLVEELFFFAASLMNNHFTLCQGKFAYRSKLLELVH